MGNTVHTLSVSMSVRNKYEFVSPLSVICNTKGTFWSDLCENWRVLYERNKNGKRHIYTKPDSP